MNVTPLGQVDLADKISVAVARKSLDAAQEQGDALVELLRAAAQIGSGGRAAIAAQAGPCETGQCLDVTA